MQLMSVQLDGLVDFRIVTDVSDKVCLDTHAQNHPIAGKSALRIEVTT